MEALYLRLQSLIAARVIHPPTVVNLSEYVTSRPFLETDIESVDMRVKFMYMFALWEGYALVKAAEKTEGDEAERLRLQGFFLFVCFFDSSLSSFVQLQASIGRRCRSFQATV